MEIEDIYHLDELARQYHKDGKYSHAIKLYSQIIETWGELRYLFSRGLVYLSMRDYQTALDDFERITLITDKKFMVDSYIIFQGVCQWCLWRPDKAIELWQQSQLAPYSDAGSGVTAAGLLLYASERTYNEELRRQSWSLLKQYAKGGNHEWPTIIAPYLLREIGADELNYVIKQIVEERLVKRWECQSDFYVAVRALCEKDLAVFRKRLSACANNRQCLDEFERYLAIWEEQNDFPILLA